MGDGMGDGVADDMGDGVADDMGDDMGDGMGVSCTVSACALRPQPSLSPSLPQPSRHLSHSEPYPCALNLHAIRLSLNVHVTLHASSHHPSPSPPPPSGRERPVLYSSSETQTSCTR